MKKVLSVLLSILLVISISVCAFAENNYVTLTSSSSKANIGDVIDVDLNVSSEVVGLAVLIKYDPSAYEIVSENFTDTYNTPNKNGQPQCLMEVNKNVSGERRITAVTTDNSVTAGSFYKMKFRVLKTNSNINLSIYEAQTIDPNNKDELINHAGDNPEFILTISEGGQVATATETNTYVAPSTTAPITDNEETYTNEKGEAFVQTVKATVTDANGNVITANDNGTPKSSSSTTQAVILCLAVLLIVVAVALVLVNKKKPKENKDNAEEKKNDKKEK